MTNLKNILNGVYHKTLKGREDIEIEDIKYDSRKVKENDIYVALIGSTNDGHDYILDAIKMVLK